MFLYLFPGTMPEDPQLEHVYELKSDEETFYVFEATHPLDTSIDSRSAYQAIDSSGTLAGGFAVLNNIPVSEDGRSAFEERFMNRARRVESMEGFAGIRVLRPLQGDTYIILTIWQSEDHFKKWQDSEAYNHAHQKRDTPQGITQQRPEIFARPSFVKTFHVSSTENNHNESC
ncbi:antibiotic biosynthesis monooxygenase [Saccharibacillus sp. JS10]|uniref:antibiotic biosynthesis monooxygenase family protein n=1 Tax=Saccharibacillus sp. JS10 TaxID=2950552 RepID=UPI00210F18F2|nr:antibiotic biosynthesis monooxygenase [Saccharibacillus sp. JS10]MCQ4087601.1 antibiotic biosynthesis monooxygenase [Saccharibacillus sp. JS10]